jgi:predicted enzyme related to lactoylglutathione lyase
MVGHAIVHFEIPGDNMGNLMTFYSELFGWRFERAPGPEEYWMIQTVPEADSPAPTVNGGLFKRESADQHIINYISVESLGDCSRRIEELGGRVVTPKREVFDMGWVAVAEDPDGNRFAIWQDLG